MHGVSGDGRSFNPLDRQDIFFDLSIDHGKEIGMAVVVDGYRFDQFFILEQDPGPVVAGITGAEFSAEDGLLVKGFPGGLAMIMGAMAGLDETQAFDEA